MYAESFCFHVPPPSNPAIFARPPLPFLSRSKISLSCTRKYLNLHKYPFVRHTFVSSISQLLHRSRNNSIPFIDKIVFLTKLSVFSGAFSKKKRKKEKEREKELITLHNLHTTDVHDRKLDRRTSSPVLAYDK